MDKVLQAPIYSKPKSFYEHFERKQGDPQQTHYCPGCGHGVVTNFIAEAIDDFNIRDRTIFISPVGCAVFSYVYLDVGNVQAAHGRAPAVATAIKRGRPESIVLCCQGDGDLAAIGSSEILHAANRGENLTVIFINNAIYGMTGGQMAPTTVLSQRTTTTPQGRSSDEGFPLKVCELLSTLQAPVYLERVALADNRTLMKARKAVRKAIQNQIEGRGFSLVEILSPCPVQWGMSPEDSCHWIMETMSKTFPLGVFKDSRKRPDPVQKQLGSPIERPRLSPEEVERIIGMPDGDGREPALTLPVVSERYENPRMIISGFGGQGGLFLGEILAEAAMRHGFRVSWLPSYGPEMRSGTAHCHVIISREPIDSPLVDHCTTLIALNEPSLTRFMPKTIAGGLLIYDSSLVPSAPSRQDLETISIPATAIADKLGNAKGANMVILGAYLAKTKLVAQDTIARTLAKKLLDKDLLELNLKALNAGREFLSKGGNQSPESLL